MEEVVNTLFNIFTYICFIFETANKRASDTLLGMALWDGVADSGHVVKGEPKTDRQTDRQTDSFQPYCHAIKHAVFKKEPMSA